MGVVCGGLPNEWKGALQPPEQFPGEYSGNFGIWELHTETVKAIQPGDTASFWARVLNLFRKELSEIDADRMVEMIRSMLIIEPAQRPTAQAVLNEC